VLKLQRARGVQVNARIEPYAFFLDNKRRDWFVPAVADFKEHLRRQIKFIKNSCDLYDQGHIEEALRIAVSLRVLFHDTKRSVSLLEHLNSKSISLLSTAAPFVEEPAFPNLYLVDLMVNVNRVDDIRCHCGPLLDEAMRKDEIAFETWWQKELVIEHKQPPSVFTRRDLVLAAANKDGGAHVDEKLDPMYEAICRGSGIEIEFVFQPQWKHPPVTLPFENIHYASLRQIAYETLNSPALLSLAA
jgi:hypothetical protein